MYTESNRHRNSYWDWKQLVKYSEVNVLKARFTIGGSFRSPCTTGLYEVLLQGHGYCEVIQKRI